MKFITEQMAVKNLRRRPVRTWCMVFFVFMLSAALFLSSVLVESMQGSLQKTVDRMGADVIVVPEEYERDMADSLFLGELCDFTFDSRWVDTVLSIEEIEQATPQLYMASLAASCCSAETQLIAIDPETDFIVTPWLEENDLPPLQEGQMYLGYNVAPAEPGKITFFNEDYEVLGKLEQTGTSYDTCVFMTWDTAQQIMNSDQWQLIFRGENDDAASMVSSLMIRVKDGEDPKALAREINYSLDDSAPISAYTTNGIFSGVTDSVQSMSIYSTVLLVVMLILVVAALMSVFTITINERTEEFGILASLGVSSGKLGGIVLTEGAVIGLVGGVLGAAFAAVALLIFADPIMVKLQIPQLDTSLPYLLALGGICLALSVAVSLLTSLYSAWKISRTRLDNLIKGEEL